MPHTTAHELDEHAAHSIREAILTVKRAFAEGLASVGDLPRTEQAAKELAEVLDKEAAVEASLALRERAAAASPPPGGGKRAAVLVDGSANSLTALRWAVDNVLDPADDLYLATVTPGPDFAADGDRCLREAYDYAHNAGVAAARLHTRRLDAQERSSTAGVGESITRFVEDSGVGMVVLGSRGMGSIKRSLMGALGMGSVSDFCVQNLAVPIVVVKHLE